MSLRRFRPLDRLGSIKLKLGVAIVAGIGASWLVSRLAYRYGAPDFPRAVIRAAVALIVVQILARGMTSPLREMAHAARRMASGDWSQRVTDTSADEVGELARAFNAMAAELEVVDRMRQDLVANVSHELRTPISALQARLENIVDGVEQPDPEMLRSMLDQTERLGRLAAQLLDLSRLESGAVPLRLEEVELAPLLDAVAAEARLHAPGRAIETVVEPAQLILVADPDRVHQVLANLTANALRHGPEDRPVTVSAVAEDGHVVLTVADEGPGIPLAEVERVFERFYRADSVRPSSSGGAGLGLSIARWIVDLHGGHISATANQPRGCAMVCRLPIPEPEGGTS
ncbi:MAG TPA: ATP-binding protein [Acidimicrobiales bacterium]|jgi:signal transduction histidine kinase